MNVLLTGATGFIGSAIANTLVCGRHEITVILRRPSKNLDDTVTQVVCDLEDLTDLPECIFSKIDCVIHSSARAHVMAEKLRDPLDEYRKINRDATLNLAKLASENGVKRFVYLSSIKVNGELTQFGNLFKPDDKFSSVDAYGISKYEAELGLLKLAKNSGMEVVIIRPPLIYGPKVKGNFATMINWIIKGIPLPFGFINNKRSLIALDNLVDFIMLCADRARSPTAANQVFLVSDCQDVSTTTLLSKVGRAYGVRARLLPVPVSFMRFAAKLLGKGNMADRLFGDLQVDSSKARELLGWKPVVTLDEQLRKMAVFDKNSGKQ